MKRLSLTTLLLIATAPASAQSFDEGPEIRLELPRERSSRHEPSLATNESPSMPRLGFPLVILAGSAGMLVSGIALAPISIFADDDPDPRARRMSIGLTTAGLALMIAGIRWLTLRIERRRRIRRRSHRSATHTSAPNPG